MCNIGSPTCFQSYVDSSQYRAPSLVCFIIEIDARTIRLHLSRLSHRSALQFGHQVGLQPISQNCLRPLGCKSMWRLWSQPLARQYSVTASQCGQRSRSAGDPLEGRISRALLFTLTKAPTISGALMLATLPLVIKTTRKMPSSTSSAGRWWDETNGREGFLRTGAA